MELQLDVRLQDVGEGSVIRRLHGEHDSSQSLTIRFLR